MAQFLKRISIFVTALLLFFVTWQVMLVAAISSRGNEITHGNTVFAGDSRVSFLYQSPDNYALAAEPLLYTYYKLAFIMRQKHLDTVVLGVGYSSFSSYYDSYIERSDIMEPYYLLLPREMKWNNFTRVRHPRLISDRTQELFFRNRAIIGEYKLPPQGKYFTKRECDARIKEQYHRRTICNTNVRYFDSVKQLCSRNAVTLILLNPPAHPYYEANVPDAFVANYHQIVAGCQLWNFSQAMSDDSLFLPDGDHVTAKGVAIMTRKIDSMRALARK
jgi:hypothetical protein